MVWNRTKFKDYQTKAHKEKREARDRSKKNAEARNNPMRGEGGDKKKL